MVVRSLVGRTATLLLGGCLLMGCTASASQSTSLPAGECLRHVRHVLRDADFNEELQVVAQVDDTAVFGRHGSYRAELQCKGENRTVNFVVTGPDSDQATWYKNAIVAKF